MERQAKQAIVAMLNALEPHRADDMVLLNTYASLLANHSTQAICEAAKRFMAGEVKRDKGFPPRTDEFCEEVRRREDHHRILAERERRLALPEPKRPFGHGTAPFEKGARDIAADMKGRPILATNIPHHEYVNRARKREFPAGSMWAADGNVYGPKEQANAKAA